MRQSPPRQTPALLVDFVVFRADRGHAASLCSFRSSHRWSANVANGIASACDRGSHIDRDTLRSRSRTRNRSSRRSSSCDRCRRSRGRNFTQQSRNFCIIQRSHAIAFALGLFRGNRRLAPLLSCGNLFLNFGTEVARYGDGGRRSRCSRSWRRGRGNRCGDVSEVGAAAAGAGAPAPPSQGIGTPALRASMSASVNSGRPERLRYACSADITELFSALRGQAGRRPRTPDSAIRPYPLICTYSARISKSFSPFKYFFETMTAAILIRRD